MPMTTAMQEKKAPAPKPLRLDGRTEKEVRRSFGLDPARISFAESPEVEAMGARAVARGNVISFAPGEFTPGTAEGRMVLGHELEHVRSQADGEGPMTGGVLEEPSFEAAADRAGAAFASGSLTSAGPVDAGALAGQSAPAQMLGRKKKAAAPVPAYEPMSPEEGQSIFEGGARMSSGNNLHRRYMPVMGNALDRYNAFLNSGEAKKLGKKHDPNADVMRRFSGGTGALATKGLLYDDSTIKSADKIFDIVSDLVDEPEFQNYVRDLFANEGGANYDRVRETDQAQPGDSHFSQYMMGTLAVKGLDPTAPAGMKRRNDIFSKHKDPKEAQRIYNKANDNIESQSSMMTKAAAILSKGEDLRRIDIEQIPEELRPFIGRYESIRQRVLQTGMPAVRPEVMGKLSDEERALAQPAAAAPTEAAPAEESRYVSPGYLSAKHWKTGAAEPMTERQQEVMSRWLGSSGEAAPAPKKKSRNPFKKLWSKIRGT